jgi:hypothetical protein
MDIRIYQPKKNHGIAYNVKELFHTHEFMYEHKTMVVTDPIVYINSIDYGPVPEIDLPHLIAVKGGSIEMYTGSVIQIESKGKSEYWVSTVSGWHKLG